MSQKPYQKCVDACIECATTCNHCAISCLEDKEVRHLIKCIRFDLECSIFCRVAAELMSMGSRYAKEMCQLCATVCNACADECEKHAGAGIDHCKECADACRACAKETMEVYQELKKEGEPDDKRVVYQDECTVISHAAAELMSLESTWCKQISELNTTVCMTYADGLENLVQKEVNYARECATIATKAHQHFEGQGRNTAEQAVIQKEVIKKKVKHSSALLAASLWRSPLHHSLAHTSGGLKGRFANMGTNVSYEEEDS